MTPAIAVRAFVLTTLLVAGAWTSDLPILLASSTIACVWLTAIAVERQQVPPLVAAVCDAGLIGVICALALSSAPVVLAALAVPPFAAALRSGLHAALVAVSAELVALVLVCGLAYGVLRPEQSADILTWTLAGVGLGLIGTYLHRAATPDTLSALRDEATAEERRRLAREFHDGVAQEIASMGYLVDALMDGATPEQREQLRRLRDRITATVADVRRSVQALRTTAAEHESLGDAIGSFARHLSGRGRPTISVTLDEGPTRLRPEVEAELLRISQEAMTNATRHAHASQIEVRCQVDPPRALIEVSDDGIGLQPPRADSHGLEIMAERARLIDARLSITKAEPHGTVVTLRLTGETQPGLRIPRPRQSTESLPPKPGSRLKAIPRD